MRATECAESPRASAPFGQKATRDRRGDDSRRPHGFEEHAPDLAGALLLLVGRDGESLAALAAAVREYLLTATRRHAGSEAVGADATEVVGLVRPFHGADPRNLGRAAERTIPEGACQAYPFERGTTVAGRAVGEPRAPSRPSRRPRTSDYNRNGVRCRRHGTLASSGRGADTSIGRRAGFDGMRVWAPQPGGCPSASLDVHARPDGRPGRA